MGKDFSETPARSFFSETCENGREAVVGTLKNQYLMIIIFITLMTCPFFHVCKIKEKKNYFFVWYEEKKNFCTNGIGSQKTHLYNFISIIHMTFDNRFFSPVLCVSIVTEKKSIEQASKRERTSLQKSLLLLFHSLFFRQCLAGMNTTSLPKWSTLRSCYIIYFGIKFRNLKWIFARILWRSFLCVDRRIISISYYYENYLF